MSKRTGDHGYRAGWCIHYRSPSQGIGKPFLTTCEAGVDYQFEGVKFDQRPCFLTKKGESKPGAVPCPKLRRPTPEEIALAEEFSERRMKMMVTAMQGISDWRKRNKGRSNSEIVECPVCRGKLHLSISAYNGHVHGHCETPECVSWME